MSRVGLAGIASLIVASASAKTAAPLAQCQPVNFGGATVCAVDMSRYTHSASVAMPVCPSGVTSTGGPLLCEQSFAAALTDARRYFAAAGSASRSYLITIPSGAYDLSSQGTVLPASQGVIDVSGIAPASSGCLDAAAAATGTVTLSGNPCLIISGAGADKTTLTTANGVTAIYGRNVSHVLIENMTLVQPNKSTTQGIFVGQGTQYVQGVTYPTLTLDIAPGFPTPMALYMINCARNGAAGCSPSGFATLANDIYLRAYTNTASPQLIPSTSAVNSNAQYAWGFPGWSGVPTMMVPPIQPDAAAFPNRWTLTSSQPLNHRAFPSYFSETTSSVANLICMKVDNAQTFGFDDHAAGGTDVIMNNMVWIGASRGVFRGIRGSLTGDGYGAQVYNSTIRRGPAVRGQLPCLSTQSGGMEFGSPTDPPIYGNIVFGLTAEATGDDSIAMFNDIGGAPTGRGGTYPQSVIAQSSIGNSFARDILLTNAQQYSGMAGNSRVAVDAFTQSHIAEAGHCDPLVLGNGNCPVTYVTY